MSEAILRCRDVHKSFGPPEKRVEVLSGLELDLERGEMVAILGESGAGKTTLLHLIGAIGSPASGSIRFRGTEITTAGADVRAEYRNRQVGFVFQFHHLLPEFTAVENAMMPLLIRGESKQRARSRATTILGDLGLGDQIGRRPTELSGGEQQRVAIARAIVGGPALLLADEPTGNLDEKNAESVFGLLLDLQRRRSMTTLLATHSERLAASCSRVLRMERGSLTVPGSGRYNAAAGASRVPR